MDSIPDPQNKFFPIKFNKRMNINSNKSIDKDSRVGELLASQKKSKTNSIRLQKDSHPSTSKTSSFRIRNSKQCVTSEKTNAKIKPHIRRVKNKSIHFLKSNYSESSGINTPKLGLSQKRITAKIYEKTKNIKTHDRSKTGLGKLEKNINLFDKMKIRSSRGKKEIGNNTSIIEKDVIEESKNDNLKIVETEGEEKQANHIFEIDVHVPAIKEQNEDFPIEKKEIEEENEDSKINISE